MPNGGLLVSTERPQSVQDHEGATNSGFRGDRPTISPLSSQSWALQPRRQGVAQPTDQRDVGAAQLRNHEDQRQGPQDITNSTRDRLWRARPHTQSVDAIRKQSANRKFFDKKFDDNRDGDYEEIN